MTMPTHEARIAKQCITELLAAGYRLAVYDGEEITTEITTDADVIFAAMHTTDEDHIYVYRHGDAKTRKPYGWVFFVYGNEPGVVISDYTTNLESALIATNALADRIMDGEE